MTGSGRPGSTAAAAPGRGPRVSADGAARLAALALFALVVYLAGYRPAIGVDAYFDPTGQLALTIRAANDGHPFAAYSPREPSRVVRLDRFASGYYDPGLPALLSATSIVGRAIRGPSFQVDRRTIVRIVFALCLLAAVVAISPALPLPVSLGGLVALAAAILVPVDGQHAFNWPRWWEAYGAVLVGMLVVGLLTARPGRWRAGYFAGLTILAGCARLLRDEVVVTTHAALGALVATLLVLWLVARWRVRSPAAAASVRRLLYRSVLAGAVFYAGLAAAPYVLRGAIAAAWRIPFAATTTAVHGTGHSLYLSLGHVPNPYGISWRDNVAMSHSHLIDPTVRIEDPRYQDVLRREALRIMLESPWLLLANLARNAAGTLAFLGSSTPLRAIAALAALVVLGALALLVRHPRPERLALAAALAGLAAGATAPALVIHPEYAFGTQAVVMLLAFMLPGALLAARRERAAAAAGEPAATAADVPRRVTMAAAARLGLAALAAAAIAGGWSAWQAARAAALQGVAAGATHPLADLQRDGFRYARVFNDLPVPVQERLIAAMAASGDAAVAVPSPDAAVAGFRPVLVIHTPWQLHVIAWLGREQPLSAMPVGSAFAFLGTCIGCERVREDLPNDPYALTDAHVRLDVASIHNQAWADRYQMLSVPLATGARPAGEILLALQHIVPEAPSAVALALRTDATWRVRFP